MVSDPGKPGTWPYSIACCPEQSDDVGAIEILVALTDTGENPNVRLAVGRHLDLDGPTGGFGLPDELTHPRILLVAGGAGIAPIRAIIAHLVRQHSDRVVSLLYSARSRDEFAFVDEFRDHAAAGRLEFHQTVTRSGSRTWKGSRGRITDAHFAEVLHAPEETLCLVCGPPAMVEQSVEALERLGVPAGSIRREQWGS